MAQNERTQGPKEAQRTGGTSQATSRGATMEEGTRGSSLAYGGPGTSVSMGGAASPFSFVRRMMEDMDRLFDEFGMGPSILSPFFGPTFFREGGRTWTPQIEAFEEGNDLVVRADLPGLRPEDIRIHLRDDLLTIGGERREERAEEREGWRHSERGYGRFERTLRVPGCDPGSCEARFENGVLEVRMKMLEQHRGRSIPVKSGPSAGTGRGTA